MYAFILLTQLMKSSVPVNFASFVTLSRPEISVAIIALDEIVGRCFKIGACFSHFKAVLPCVVSVPPVFPFVSLPVFLRPLSTLVLLTVECNPHYYLVMPYMCHCQYLPVL